MLIAVVWNKDVPSEVARLFRISKVGDVLIAVGSIGVLVFGIWLAIDGDGYEVWDGWVIAALVLWFVMGAFGSRTGKIYNVARDRRERSRARARTRRTPSCARWSRTAAASGSTRAGSSSSFSSSST